MLKTKILLSCLLMSFGAASFAAASCSAPASSAHAPIVPASSEKPAQAKTDNAFSSELKEAVERFQTRYPKTQVSAFALTPFKGLFEAAVGKEVVYFDKTARFVLSGRLLDMDQGKDLTEARLKDLRRVPFKDFPLEKAVKTVYGSGQKKLVVFTDVDCPFSRRLSETLPELKDTTVYTFLFPLETIHPEAREKSDAIWCSSNPAESMEGALKGKEVAPTVKGNPLCKSPVSEILTLAKKLGVAGTPTLFNEAGDRISGALPLEKLQAFVNEGAPVKTLAEKTHHES